MAIIIFGWIQSLGYRKPRRLSLLLHFETQEGQFFLGLGRRYWRCRRCSWFRIDLGHLALTLGRKCRFYWKLWALLGQSGSWVWGWNHWSLIPLLILMQFWLGSFCNGKAVQVFLLWSYLLSSSKCTHSNWYTIVLKFGLSWLYQRHCQRWWLLRK